VPDRVHQGLEARDARERVRERTLDDEPVGRRQPVERGLALPPLAPRPQRGPDRS
jgi:hypothetical protein